MNRPLRRLLKILHTLGAVGLMGGMAALTVFTILQPASFSGSSYALLMDAAAKIAAWIILPSMTLTVIAGLLAIAVNPGLHDAGWAWAKAATGILIFEGALHVVGPIQDEAKHGAVALAASLDPASVTRLFVSERNTLLVLLAVCAVNVVLGIWRPRLM